MAALKLLHTADWQIGKVFRNIPGDAGALLRQQRFATVEALAGLAAEQAVDAVLVAGDVFDADGVSDDTVRRTLAALDGFDGPWVLLPGNHDAALASSVWTRMAALGKADNVILPVEDAPLLLCNGRLAVLPGILRRKHEPLDVTAWFDGADTPEGVFRVGLAHGSIEGASAADSEAPNTIAADRADRARLDYFALGDWHSRREIGPRTWYAGTPEADRYRSPDPGHALVVTLTGPGAAPVVTPVQVGHYTWTRLEVDVAGDQASAQVDDTLAALPGEAGRQVIRLILRGVVSLAQRQAVDEAIAGWRARFHFLEDRTNGLIAEPTDDDLDAIDHQGFVRDAVEALRETAAGESEPARRHGGRCRSCGRNMPRWQRATARCACAGSTFATFESWSAGLPLPGCPTGCR